MREKGNLLSPQPLSPTTYFNVTFNPVGSSQFRFSRRTSKQLVVSPLTVSHLVLRGLCRRIPPAHSLKRAYLVLFECGQP